MPLPKILFAIAGTVGLAVWGIKLIVAEILRFYHVWSWPKVTGRILDSQVTVRGGGDPGDIYGFIIKYQYKINETFYKGTAKLIWHETILREPAETLRDIYLVGLNLPIAYNPVKVEQSEPADRRQSRFRLSAIVYGAILVILSVMWFIGTTNGFTFQ